MYTVGITQKSLYMAGKHIYVSFRIYICITEVVNTVKFRCIQILSLCLKEIELHV